MPGLQTEFPFTLPKGYVDAEGNLHRHGTMRLATARDEIEPLRDQRIGGADDPYLTILVLSRVVTELGTLRNVTPHEVESLFAADLAFLQDLYGIVNFGDADDIAALKGAAVDEAAHLSIEPEHTDVAAAADEPSEDLERTHMVRRRDRIEEVTRRVAQ
jgi:hypothetical protein